MKMDKDFLGRLCYSVLCKDAAILLFLRYGEKIMFHYLDHAATTQVRPEAAQAALEAMTEGWGNPSSRLIGIQLIIFYSYN